MRASIMVMVLALITIASSMRDVRADDGSSARCAKNAQSIHVMCLKFLTRNGGKYPKSLDDLMSDDYFSKQEADEIFYSPFATSKDSNSYELLLPGAGIPKDKRTIVMRCKYAGADGKTTVVFGDGHIERIVVEKPKENGSGK